MPVVAIIRVARIVLISTAVVTVSVLWIVMTSLLELRLPPGSVGCQWIWSTVHRPARFTAREKRTA